MAPSYRSASRSPRPPEQREQPAQRVVVAVGHALLERDDAVVGDRDALGADLRAALGDVAVADPVLLLEIGLAVLDVERVHLERRRVDQEARSDELLVLVVVAQHVAHVLAQEALDALAELLHPVDVGLRHAPGAVGRVRRPRLEGLDAPLDRVVPGDIGDEVLDRWEGPDRLDRDRPGKVEVGQPRHAGQARPAVDLGRARAALAGLAVPAQRQVGRRLGLDLVQGVEHDHALRDLGLVVAELAAPCVAAPDAEGRTRHQPISAMMRRCSSLSGTSGSRRTAIAPSAPLAITWLKRANSSLLAGQSSRKWAPRLSRRSRAERVTASDTVSRLCRSRAVCQPGLYCRLPGTSTRPARSRSRPMAASASRISASVRTMPTWSCMTRCSSCWMA